MFHIFKYRFICFIKDKTILFWSLLFPIGLATLFFFAFSNLGSESNLDVIKVAVVDNGNKDFNAVVEELSKEGDNQILDATYTSEKKAKKLVKDGEVEAALVSSDKPTVLYRNDTLETQILKEVVQSYLRINATVNTIANENPQKMNDMVITDLIENKVLVKDYGSNAGSSDPTMQYFYTIIAMTCMYGGFWGLKSISDTQANQSDRAIRLNIAPTHKMKLVFIDYLVTFTLMVVELAITFAYLILVLGVDFGSYFPQVIGVSLCGVLMSLGMGIMIGCISKLKENTNITIISMGSLFSCFLAGMMASNMPYILNQSVPFIKYINPATLITNSFNMLYYYEDISPVYINMAILVGMGIIALIISYNVLRRKAYASI
ncbi:ABC-2 type transport system permease protein [Breznakia sp. PF5-3]|uniref:ABC transporter permease n=1 Tax=unclassified Breznakia TaxID=2623764 RepID=UPI00240747E8|nr:MULTISPECIES: ABC transporter permease [unclassified Breznakia]MDL2276055.1 ABC transporter permease [Breznakia sp. OttesenSCG-928-G09]MDF9825504.1 ABC-2 type transport system permease protein [Breznakia sp. PM6-1]MDF9836374.1 ABC-2 type transport system permease protein [Breznakia sp. PF5-3]MDF9837490.1 ABC-2 type transport system permease protein [Breznakia sp. PFB2-8]MDF9859447.1 ABC-2 type transport system permease protein [Breznakia sp. PH5-24]